MIAASIAVGLFATGVMDLGALLLARAGVMVKPDTRFLGRWISRLAAGKLRVRTTISQEPQEPGERLVGLVSHYLIGSVLAVIGLAVTRSVAGLLLYGVFTSVFPWFFMFPMMGFGLFASRSPREAKLLRSSLINHFDYGFGLAVGLHILLALQV